MRARIHFRQMIWRVTPLVVWVTICITWIEWKQTQRQNNGFSRFSFIQHLRVYETKQNTLDPRDLQFHCYIGVILRNHRRRKKKILFILICKRKMREDLQNEIGDMNYFSWENQKTKDPYHMHNIKDTRQSNHDTNRYLSSKPFLAWTVLCEYDLVFFYSFWMLTNRQKWKEQRKNLSRKIFWVNDVKCAFDAFVIQSIKRRFIIKRQTEDMEKKLGWKKTERCDSKRNEEKCCNMTTMIIGMLMMTRTLLPILTQRRMFSISDCPISLFGSDDLFSRVDVYVGVCVRLNQLIIRWPACKRSFYCRCKYLFIVLYSPAK